MATSLLKAALKLNDVLPSCSAGTFSKVPVRVSVLVMVPSPTSSSSVALVGPCRMMLKVSLGSLTPSSTIPTSRVLLVCPGSKVIFSCPAQSTSLALAVPDEKRALTVTVLVVARLRLTMKSMVASTPSSAVASLIETATGVELTMVPTPLESAKTAPVGLRRITANFSFPSSTRSSMIGTETVFSVSPGWNVSVPLTIRPVFQPVPRVSPRFGVSTALSVRSVAWSSWLQPRSGVLRVSMPSPCSRLWLRRCPAPILDPLFLAGSFSPGRTFRFVSPGE